MLKTIGRDVVKDKKLTVLIGKDFNPETAVSIEVKKFKIGKLKGFALDITGNNSMVGIGVSKDIYANEVIELDAGIYATKNVEKLFNMKKLPDIRIGASVKWRF